MRLTCFGFFISLNEVYLWNGSLYNKSRGTIPIKEDPDEFITREMVFSGLAKNNIHFHINKPPWTYRSLILQRIQSRNHHELRIL
jgi:hypothetical protein